MPAKYEPAAERRKREWTEYRRERELEEQQRREAVIAEFGGPENPGLVHALVDEIRRYRFVVQQLTDALAWAREGRPFIAMPGGPYKRDDASPTVTPV